MSDKTLPQYVQTETSTPTHSSVGLERAFSITLAFCSEPRVLSQALEVVTRAISTYLVKKAGFTHTTAKTGAVTLIQRFGSALNLNIHFHMLFLDGVYELDSSGTTANFHAIETPTSIEMNSLLHRISECIARLLEREGYLERDSQEGSLLLDGFDDDVSNELQGSSITSRIAVGSQRGKKVFTLKTLPAQDEEADEINGQTLAKGGGFSLHAGVSAKSYQRDIDVTVCRHCQGTVRIIGCIEDRQVINKILAHINRKQEPLALVMTGTGIRAPPTDSRSLMTQ